MCCDFAIAVVGFIFVTSLFLDLGYKAYSIVFK